MRFTRATLQIALMLAPAVLPAQISDTAPPQILSLSLSPSAVDVTLAQASVGLTTRVTDDLAGVQLVCAVLRGPIASQSTAVTCANRTGGTGLDGTYFINLVIPRYVVPGTWNVDSLSLTDNAGNNVFLTTANLQSKGFSTGVSVSSTPDTQPPTLTSVLFNTPTVDVSAGASNLVLTLGITDNLAGFDRDRFVEFRLALISPSGQNQYVMARDFIRISGDALNGQYQITRPIPAFSEAGSWRINYLRLVDSAGNLVFLTTAAIQAAGLPTTFTVIDTNSDTSPPQLVSMTFSPSLIDTSEASRDVTVTMRLTDNLAGPDFAPDHPFASFLHGITFRSASGRQNRDCCAFPPTFTLVSGTLRDGIWTGRVTFPRYSEGGTWLATIVSVKDAAQNALNLSSAELALRGLPFELTLFGPTPTTDGNVGTAGGTVTDRVFGNRASVTFPPNSVAADTAVAVEVLTTPLPVPVPAGFGSSSLFVSINLTPTPVFPLPPPGLTVTIPLPAFMAPGTVITLFRFDTVTGGLVPAVSVTGGNVTGIVNPDGLSARFTGVSRLSTVVGFVPVANSVLGDVNGDQKVDCEDIGIVKAAFGKRSGQAGFVGQADVTRDGVVDVRDLAIVSRQLPTGTVCSN